MKRPKKKAEALKPNVRRPSATRNRFFENAGALALLSLLTWFVYEPALNRVFAGDQIGYMSELGGSESLRDGLARTDYTATRQFERGDDGLFRPLVFIWLAVGHTLFSYHYVSWNLATLALHVLTAFFLYRFVARIQPPLFAFAAAALFAVMKPGLELPLWNHLGGYIMAGMFFIIALGAFVRMTIIDSAPGRSVSWTYALAFTAAVFCHEAMVPICAMAGVLIIGLDWKRGRGIRLRRLLTVAAPLVAFAGPYILHLQRVHRIAYVDHHDERGIFAYSNVLSLVTRIPDTVAQWTSEIAAPSALHFTIGAYYRFLKSFAFSWQEPLHLFNLALAGAVLVVIALTQSRRHWARVWPTLLLLCGAVAAYIAIIAFGRSQPETLAITYYLHLFSLMVVALIWTLADFGRLSGAKAVAAGTVLGAFMLLHAFETRAVTTQVGLANERAARFLDQVSDFVDKRKTESGFTFAIRGQTFDIDPPFPMRKGYADQGNGVLVRRVSEILFMPYYDAKNPRYLLEWTGSAIFVSPTS